MPAADLVICESTYGGRVHDSLEQMIDALAKVVERTRARGGQVLVQLTELVLKFETPLTLSVSLSHTDPDGGHALRDLPRMHRRDAIPRLLHGGSSRRG